MYLIVGEECAQNLMNDLPSSQCVQRFISKFLGLAIIFSSAILKVPQILKIVGSKSVAGLSIITFYMEVVSYSFTLAYSMTMVKILLNGRTSP